MPTPHEILEVAKTATQEEIRKAYKKLVLKHHPDKGGSREKFEQTKKAYDEICNPEAFFSPVKSASSSSRSTFTSAPSSTMSDQAMWAYIAAMQQEEKSKPPKPEHWRAKFLSENSNFNHYAERIIEMLKSEIAEPTVILQNLFDIYLETGTRFNFFGYGRIHIPLPSNPALNLFGYGRTHIPMVKELKKILQKPSAKDLDANEMPTGIAEVFSHINKEPTPLNSQGELVDLFNAFFSMYPLYLTLLDDSHKLKKQITVTVFNDILVQTIVRERTRDLIYSIRNLPSLSQSDVEMIKLTGELEQAINTTINNLKAFTFGQVDKHILMKNLVCLTESAEPALIQHLILPYILGALGQEIHNIVLYSDLEKILIKAIQSVEITYVEKQILPKLIDTKHLHEEQYLGPVLIEIALRLGKDTAEKVILPLLLQSFDNGQEVTRERAFSSLVTMLHLLSPEIILETLVPELLKELKKEDPDDHSIYSIYANLCTLANSAKESDKMKWVEIVQLLSASFSKDIEGSLADARNGDTTMIRDKLVALSSEVIAKEIMPTVMKKLSKPGKKISQSTLFFLESLSELTDDKLSKEFKKIIFNKLYAFCADNYSPEFLEIVQKYLPFNTDMNIFSDLFEQLLARAKFTSYQKHDSMIEPLLADVVQYVDPMLLQTRLLPNILTHASFKKIGKLSPLYKVLERALPRLDINYVMQAVYPEFFSRTLKSQNEAALLIPFTSKLPFVTTVQLTMQLIQSIEENEFFSAAQLMLLTDFCKQHNIKLGARKLHVDAEQRQEASSSMAFSL